MKLANGRVVLERRPNSPYWFARIRTGNGKWITRTTKQADVAQAGQTALGFLLTPEVSKKDTLEVYITKYLQSLDSEINQKPIYKEYRAIVRNWILLYFGDKVPDQITSQDIKLYRQWVEKKKAKQLAKATINCHHVPLRAIFRIAHDAGDMPIVPELTIKNVGVAGQRRDAIPPAHYALLLRACRAWWCEAEHPSYTGGASEALAHVHAVSGWHRMPAGH